MKFTTLIKIWILSIACLAGFQAAALAAVRVAVLPFQINADKDYTYLQKGIDDMLSSRLAWADKVEVIDPVATANVMDSIKGMHGDSLALMVGAKLKADFALYGSITLVGESVSIDAKMLDVTGTRPPLTFFEQTQGMDSVIPRINRLATNINTTVLGRPAPSVPTVAAAPAPTPARRPEQGQGQAPLSPLAGGTAPQTTGSTLNPAFEATLPHGGQEAQSQFWKSRNFRFLINGLDVGDVNHDGLVETVLATGTPTVVVLVNGGSASASGVPCNSNWVSEWSKTGPSSIHPIKSLSAGHTFWQIIQPTRQLCQASDSQFGKPLGRSLWKVRHRSACS